MSDTVKRYAAGGPQIKLLLADEHLVLAADFDALQARHDALVAERDRLRELLLTCREYAGHSAGCSADFNAPGDPSPYRCRCLWDEERKAIDEALKGVGE